MTTTQSLQPGKGRIIAGLVVAIALLFLLQPIGWLFYELYHLTGVDLIYYGYSAFRGADHFMSGNPAWWLFSVVLGLAIATPWFKWLKSRFSKS